MRGLASFGILWVGDQDLETGSRMQYSSPTTACIGAVPRGLSRIPILSGAARITKHAGARRDDKFHRTRSGMEQKKAQMESAQQVQLAALEVARAQAEFEITIGQILNQATGGQGPSEEWLQARKEAMVQPDEPAEIEASQALNSD